jgi:hypothetical protein
MSRCVIPCLDTPITGAPLIGTGDRAPLLCTWSCYYASDHSIGSSHGTLDRWIGVPISLVACACYGYTHMSCHRAWALYIICEVHKRLFAQLTPSPVRRDLGLKRCYICVNTTTIYNKEVSGPPYIFLFQDRTFIIQHNTTWSRYSIFMPGP